MGSSRSGSFEREVLHLPKRPCGRGVRDRLPLLLQRLQPEQRRAVIARLTQGQQMQLERWVLAQKSFTVMKEYGKARLEPKNWRYRARKGRKRPAIDDRCCGTGIYQRFRSGRSTYEATCAAGPFVLSTRWTANLDLAVKYKQMLQSVRERMEGSSAEIQVSFKEAIMTELHEHGFTAKELNLTFLTRVGARYWVGRSLETPRFLAEGPSLERGLMAWQRLRKARLTVFEGACNELSLLSRHSPGELADAWGQLRSVYLDVMEESGHQRQRVLRRLERLEKKQEPRRLKAEQRWRVACKNRRLPQHRMALDSPDQGRPASSPWQPCGACRSRLPGRSQEFLLRRCERLLERWKQMMGSESNSAEVSKS